MNQMHQWQYLDVRTRYVDGFSKAQVIESSVKGIFPDNSWMDWNDYRKAMGLQGFELCGQVAIVIGGTTHGFSATFKRSLGVFSEDV